jgi:hypothetical protein
MQEILMQHAVAARNWQEAVATGDLPLMYSDVDAANVFLQSGRVLQEHVCKYNVDATEPKDLIQRVLHHPHDRRLQSAAADTQRDRGNSSRLHEVNIWMWLRNCRGSHRMLSIAEAERIRRERICKSRIRGAETATEA